MEENQLIDISASQLKAIEVAFEEHKRMPDLPNRLKVLTKYNVRVETTAKNYTVMFSPAPPKGEITLHPLFRGGYVLDKRSLKVLQKILI